jgi:acyl carrier protein
MIGAPKAEAQVPDQIEAQLIEIIARKKKLDPSVITLDSTFEELGMDSLDAADLLFTVEDAFGIVVEDDAAQSMRTVRQVVDGIRQLVSKRAGAS